MKLTSLLLFGFLSSTATVSFAEENTPRVIPRVQMSESTLGDAVKYLSEAGSVNIVLPPVLASLKVPEISLANVTAQGVLQSIANMVSEIDVRSVNDTNGTVILNIVSASQKPKMPTKVCRVFKASAKEKLQGEELEKLVQNLGDAAKMVCDANARAQGRAEAELPTVEVHPPTGILIVTGEESDVQLLGQVVQALGGEVIPLAETGRNSAIPVISTKDGTVSVQVKSTGAGAVDLSAFKIDVSKIQSEVTKQVEQAIKQAGHAKDQAEKAVKQVEGALKEIKVEVKAPEKK